jgi:hypothetical protein
VSIKHRVWHGGLALALLSLLWTIPASAITTVTEHSVTNATGNVEGETLSIRGFTTATFQICCTFSATVVFKVSSDRVNFEPIGCMPVDTNGGYFSSATTRGMWRCNINGINGLIRADVEGYASGTVNVTISLTAAGVS